MCEQYCKRYNGRGGCGHTVRKDYQRCRAAFQRPDEKPCVPPNGNMRDLPRAIDAQDDFLVGLCESRRGETPPSSKGPSLWSSCKRREIAKGYQYQTFDVPGQDRNWHPRPNAKRVILRVREADLEGEDPYEPIRLYFEANGRSMDELGGGRHFIHYQPSNAHIPQRDPKIHIVMDLEKAAHSGMLGPDFPHEVYPIRRVEGKR
ncbi:hypothetical protein BDW62DRAFT_196810 [Aspergillus aurantiobrunneus]